MAAEEAAAAADAEKQRLEAEAKAKADAEAAAVAEAEKQRLEAEAKPNADAGVRENPASPWVQFISDDDEAYYFNEQTDETTWEAPAEGVSAFRGKEDAEATNTTLLEEAETATRITLRAKAGPDYCHRFCGSVTFTLRDDGAVGVCAQDNGHDLHRCENLRTLLFDSKT